jgi:hypothetical protein
MMLNWRTQPSLVRAAALVTGVLAVLMSVIPTVVYVAMAPVIQSEVLLGGFVWRGGPILLVYLFALTAALLLNPSKRQLTGAALLIATVPVAVALMLYGLR